MLQIQRSTLLIFLFVNGCADAPPERPAPVGEAPVKSAPDGKQDGRRVDGVATGIEESAPNRPDDDVATEVEAMSGRKEDGPPAEAAATEGEVPLIAADARSLWERHGAAALPLLATFFQFVDLSGDEQQGAFDLLRDISAAVAPGDPGATAVLGATRGFLRLPITAAVQLPGESDAAPWNHALRLVVGLRDSRELGPSLVAVLRSATRGGLDPESDVVRNSVYAIAYLAYLPGRDFVVRYARRCEGLRPRILALEMLALLGDPVGAPLVAETIETADELSLVQPAARTLHTLIGSDAEPVLRRLLRREKPALARAALGPLLSIASPSALQSIVALKSSTTVQATRRAIELLLGRYGRQLQLSAEGLERLIRTSPEDAAHRIAPYARRLEWLTEDDRRLSRADLEAVLAHWRASGTLYTEEWSWVRDRHIVSVATTADEPALEAVRRSILREYRTTSLDEAYIVQRIILAVRARARRG